LTPGDFVAGIGPIGGFAEPKADTQARLTGGTADNWRWKRHMLDLTRFDTSDVKSTG
jgi:hypothetical protein